MNPISHKQAQDWLQQRLDGFLGETQAAALEDHLKTCVTCQEYAVKFERLDVALRQGYRVRAQARQFAESRSALPDSANHSFERKMRLKMKSKQVLNFTTSFAFIAAMAVLAVGFSWLISTRTTLTLPGFQGNPAPAPSSWTKDNPLTDAKQVVTILDALAQKNVTAVQQADWVHVIRQDNGQPGNDPTTYSDGWFQYSRDTQVCIKGMEIVSLKPGGTPLQILVSRAGTSGNLVQLRSGSGTVAYAKPGEYGCSLRPEFTTAGQLAARLKEERAGSTEKMDIQAWYETAQGRTEFVVKSAYKTPSNATNITKETHNFEAESGLPTQTIASLEGQDGALVSESTQVYVTEFVPVLPAAVAAQWKEFSGELQAYALGALP
jgi:hypothetical protein